MANNQIRFGVGFDVDKSGLEEAKKSLQELQKLTVFDMSESLSTEEARKQLSDIKKYASDLQTALTSSYNSTLGSINADALAKQLKQLPLKDIQASFSNAGAAGQIAFRNITTAALTSNMKLKETKSLLSSMGDTFFNSVKYTLSSSVINNFTSSISNAYGYIKKLDDSLNAIRIVTGDSASQMQDFAVQANKAAAALGQQTTAYTKAALTFYQQGLSDSEVQARTTTTLKAANVTGASATDVANDLTAVWNGFNVQQEQTELTADKLAAVADSSASDMSELATAMGKVASVANNTGVSIDQLNAMLATTISVTRQAPETVGNAYKTIFARINDIKTGAEDAEDTLGNYSGKMAALGFSVLDATGHLRDTGEVMQEIGDRWGTLTKDQQTYLAQTMAGQRQYNNLIALFDNWTEYSEMLNTSLSAEGSLNQKNDIYMESLTAHTKQLQTAIDGLIQSLADSDSFKGVIDALTNIVNLTNNFVDALGGGGNVLLGFGAILTRVFNKSLIGQIYSLAQSFQDAKYNASQLTAQRDVTQLLKDNNINANDKVMSNEINFKQKALNAGDLLSSEEHNQSNELIKNVVEAQNKLDTFNASVKNSIDLLNDELNSVGDNIDSLEDISSNKAKVYLNTLDEIREKYKIVNEEIQNNTKNLNDLNQAVNKGNIKRQKTTANRVQKDFIDVKNKVSNQSMSDEDKAKFQSLATEYENKINDAMSKKDYASVAADMETFKDKVDAFFKHLTDTANKATEEIKGDVRKTKEELEAQTEATKNAQENFEKNVINTKVNIEKVVNIATSFVQIMTAMQSLGNLPSIITDKDISGVEKFTQVIENLAVVAPLLYSNIKSLIPAFQALIESLTGASIAAGPAGLAIAAIAAALITIPALIDKITVTEKEAAEAQADLNKLWDEQADKSKKASEALSQVIDSEGNYTDLIKNYEDLSHGVNEYGENIGLTTQEFEQYHDITNQIAQLSPDLVTGYDNERNAIINKTDAVKELIEQLKKQKIEEQILSDDDYKDALDKANKVASKKQTATERIQDKNKDVANSYRTRDYLSHLSNYSAEDENQANEIQKAHDELERIINNDFTEEELQDPLKISDIYKHAISTLKYYANDKDRFQQEIDETFGDNFENAIVRTVQEATEDTLKETKQINKNFVELAKSDFLKDNEDLAGSLIELGADDKLESYISNNLSIVSDDEIKNAVQSIEDKANELKNAYEKFNKVPEEEQETLLKDLDEHNREGFQDYVNNIVKDANKVIEDSNGKVNLEDLETRLGINFLDNGNGKAQGVVYTEAQLAALKEFEQNLEQVGIKDVEKFKQDLQGMFTSDEWDELNYSINWDEVKEQGTNASEHLQKQMYLLKNSIQTSGDAVEGLIKSLGKAKTLDSVNGIWEQLKNTNVDIDYSNYSDALIRLGENYTNCAEEIENFNDVLNNPNKTAEDVDAAAGLLQTSIHIGEVAKKYKLNAESIENQARSIADAEGLDIEQAAELAIQNQRLNKGVQTLCNSWDDWSKALKKGNKTSQEFNDAMAGTVDALADMFDIQDKSIISADFFDDTTEEGKEHLEELGKAAQGDADAISALGLAVAELNVKSSELNSDFLNSLTDEGSVDLAEKLGLSNIDELTNNFESIKQHVLTGLQSIEDAVNNGTLNVGDSLTEALGSSADEWVAQLNQFAAATGMTVEQLNALLGQIGVTANVSIDHVKTKVSTPIYKEHADVTEVKLPNGQTTYEITHYTQTVDYADMDGYVDVAQIATNGADPGHANVKYTGSSGSKSSGVTKPTKKGSKGGGGGGKAYEPKTENKLDKVKDHSDALHDVTKSIKDLTNEYKRLEKQQEKTFGVEATLNNLDKQIDLLQQEQDLTRKKMDLQVKELETQRKELSELGVTFDQQTGHISNYNAILDPAIEKVRQLTEEYNKLVEAYNADKTESGQDKLKKDLDAKKKEIEEAKKVREELEKGISKYESAEDDYQSQIDEWMELRDQQVEKQIEAFNAEIELHLKFDDAKKEWNEFKNKVIDRTAEMDFLGNARAAAANFDIYYNTNGGQVEELAQHVQDIMAEAQIINDGGESSIYGRDLNKAQEDLMNYTKQLQESLSDVEDIMDNVHDIVIDAIDKTQEALDKQKDKYDQINDLIEHDINLVEAVYGENAYDSLANYYGQRANNLNQEMEYLRLQKEMWLTQMKSDTSRRDQFEKGTKEWEKLNEEVEADYDNYVQSVNDLNSAIEDAVDNAFTKWTNAVDSIAKKTKDAMLGGDAQQNQDTWEKTKWHDDRYLDRLDRANALLKIEQDINDAINSTDNVATQKKLADFREKELNDLSQINHLTQADIDYANQKLILIQKQQALEDAQQAKTKMRLRRDSQGNYTYQYVADEDNVNDKLQEYMEALNQLRNIPKDELENTYDEIYDKIDEYYSKLTELAETYKGDQEGYAAAAKDLYESYYGEEGYITLLAADASRYQKDYNEGTFQHLKGLQQQEEDDFYKFLGLNGDNADEKSIMGAIEALIGEKGIATDALDNFVNETAKNAFDNLSEQNLNTLINGDDSMESIWNLALRDIADNYEENFLPVVENGQKKILELNEEWHQDLENIEEAAGITFDAVAEGLDKDIEYTTTLLEDNKQLTDSYREQLDAVKAVEDEMTNLYNKYREVGEQAMETARQANEMWSALNGGGYDDDFDVGSIPSSSAKKALSNVSSKKSSSSGGSGGSGSAGGGGDFSPKSGKSSYKYDIVHVANSDSKYDYYKLREISTNKNIGGSGDSHGIAEIAKMKGISSSQIKGGTNGFYGFATGGYTGDWAGTDGRLAMLHQKELVLNKDDTSNMLNAVNIVRTIADKVSAMGSNLAKGFMNIFNPSNISTNNSDTTTQDIKIYADFPNANNAKEIEDALNNLVNTASQKVSKSRRSY